MLCLASIPRCGSTYLWRSIAGEPQGGYTPPDLAERHGIVKTHRPPEDVDRLDDCDRAVFLFGDVADAVVSTQDYRHDATHFANCGREYRADVDLLAVDYLDYTGLMEAWMAPPVDTIAVRYEALKDRRVRDAVEWWVDQRIEWLPWRERRTTADKVQRRRVNRAYRDLVRRVEEMSDVRWL